MMVEQQQRVPSWWRQHPNGSYALFVRSGLKPIEFEKGKPAIAVSSLDKLPSVIDTLITAVRNGELDQQFAEASKQANPRKSKRCGVTRNGGVALRMLLPFNHLKRLAVAGLPSPSCRRWSRNRSRISNNAKHDGLAAHSDTHSIRAQSVHCRNGRSSFRSVKDVWVVSWTCVTVTSSFRSAYRREVKKIWQ